MTYYVGPGSILNPINGCRGFYVDLSTRDPPLVVNPLYESPLHNPPVYPQQSGVVRTEESLADLVAKGITVLPGGL